MSSFASILSSTGEVTKVIKSIRDTLIFLGFSPNAACNPNKVGPDLGLMITEAATDFTNTVSSIAIELGGNFFLTYAALIATFIGAKVTDFLDATLNEFIMGSVVGGFLAILTGLLSIMPGLELLIQYLGVKTLENSLPLRKELAELLRIRIRNFIRLLTALDLIINGRDTMSKKGIRYLDIEKAIQYLESAQVKLSVEIAQAREAKNTVNMHNVFNADDNLKKAIDVLLNSEYAKNLGQFTKIAEALGLSAPNFNTESITDYIFQIKEEFKSTIHNPERDYNLLTQILPIIPATLQVVIFQEIFKNDIQLLIDKIPVFINNIPDIVNIMTAPLKDLLKTYKVVALVDDRKVEPFFTDPITKDIVYSNISSRIRLQEVVILLFPSMWKQIKQVGNLYINIFRRALVDIGSVVIEMKDTISSASKSLATKGFATNFRPDAAFLHDKLASSDSIAGVGTEAWVIAKKVSWATILNQVRGVLKPITSDKARLQMAGKNVPIKPLELAQSIEHAGNRLDNLKTFIVNKTFTGSSSKLEPYEDALTLAQKVIPVLSTSVGLLLFPTYLKKVLAQLKSLLISLENQIKLDTNEISLCNYYTSFVEGLPIFPLLMDMKNGPLSALYDSPLRTLVDDIMGGDLSNIIAITEGVKGVTDIAQLLICVDPKNKDWKLELAMEIAKKNPLSSTSTEELDKLQKWISGSINTAQTRIANALAIVASVSDVLAKFTSMMPNVSKDAVSIPNFSGTTKKPIKGDPAGPYIDPTNTGTPGSKDNPYLFSERTLEKSVFNNVAMSIPILDLPKDIDDVAIEIWIDNNKTCYKIRPNPLILSAAG